MSLDAACAQHQLGNFAVAEPVYRRVIAEDPGNAQALFLLGMLAIQTGRPAEAVEHLCRAVALAPDHAKAFNALGVARNAQGSTAQAAECFRTALALAPDFMDAALNLARVLAGTQPAEAEALIRQVIERVPTHAVAHSDLGSLLYRCSRHEAEAAFRHALDLAPLPEAARNLAMIYKTDGRLEEARALAPRLKDPLAQFMASTTTPAILDHVDGVPAIEAGYLAALHAAPAGTVTDPLAAFSALGHFYFAYYGRPLRHIHEATAATYRRLCPSLSYVAPHCRTIARRRRARPRVAFVSAHFHAHTINRLFAGLIVGLADRFEVLAVTTPNSRDDEAAQRLGRAVPMVRLPADMERARQVVAELEADVLIYLDIGMEPFTYFLAHARLAPLQLVTWGHPATPGLETIDGFISADYLDPPGAEADHTERLHRLPAPAFYFDRPEVPERDRTYFSLPERAPLYVCPQTLFKLHPAFDALIAGTLRADPAGRLLLLAGDVPARRAALERRFAQTIPDVAGRVIFLPALSRPDFLALLRVSNVMLDIPSFSGGNTTLEGLGAGVPIVTLPAEHLRGRLTAGLLRLAGLGHGIAETAEDYCRRAVDAANDGAAYRGAIAAQAGVLYQRRQAIADVAELVDALTAQAGN